MKKIVLALLLTLLLVSSSPAFVASIGSGEKDADALIYTVVPGTECYITALHVITNGSNDATAIVYDNTSAAAPMITEVVVVATTVHDKMLIWVTPRKISTGIYVDIDGTEATYVVEYILR